MDSRESLALFARGRDAWNAWAGEMSTAREALEAAGTWTSSPIEATWNDATRSWHAAATADFRGHQFNESVDFSGFAFPGNAQFDRVVFSGHATFDEANFSGAASFKKVNFSGRSTFDKATFSGHAAFDLATFVLHATFDEAVFSGDASVIEGTFRNDASFTEATFSGRATFDKATFSGAATFIMATFSGIAGFDRVTFSGHAAFEQVTFSSAAMFDEAMFSYGAWFGETTFLGEAWFAEVKFLHGATFPDARFSEVVKFPQTVFEGFTNFNDVQFEKLADFRAIDGRSGFSLAGATFLVVPDFIQAHFAEAPRLDNIRIQRRRSAIPTLTEAKNYFKGDQNLSASWRALKRLAVQGHDHMHEMEFFQNEMKSRRWSTDLPWHAVFWFGIFYGWFSDFGRSIVRPLIWWAASACAFALFYLHAAVARPLQCVVGSEDPWHAALWISARKALLFFGLDSSDKLTQHYACLYGVITQHAAPPGQLPADFYLDVPNSVIAAGIAQHIISAVLFFLLLLAVRNHFRIR